MKKKTIISLVILVVVVGIAAATYFYFYSKDQCGNNSSLSAILIKKTVPELAQESDAVVIGTIQEVLPSQCKRNKSGDKMVYTDYKLKVEQSIKGNVNGQITIRLPGGTIGSGANQITVSVEDNPELAKGEKVLVFLDKNGFFALPKNYYSIHGAMMGKYQITDSQAINLVETLPIGVLMNEIIAPSEPNRPTSDKIESAKTSIRQFTNDPNLELNYITTEKNPSNFTVGKVTQVGEGTWRTDTPKEWERPIYVFQQTKYIDSLCEVYEYEIDARNNQLIEVHVKYPQSDMELSQETKAKKCSSYGSLYTPLKTKTQIEAIAMDYLSRSISSFNQIRSQFVFKPSTKNAVNAPAANEWFYQDTSYKLPEGLSGDVYNYPTIRIIVSSGGKLIYYFNSVELFKN